MTTNLTICGNTVNDPELRYTASGQAVASLSVAVNHRKFNKATNEWEDDSTDFYSVSAWQKQAEHVAESLTKGMRVIVTGQLKSRSYETREGEKRTVWEITADDIGPSLKNAEATVRKTGGQGQQQSQQGGGWQQQSRQQPVDPWAQAPTESPF